MTPRRLVRGHPTPYAPLPNPAHYTNGERAYRWEKGAAAVGLLSLGRLKTAMGMLGSTNPSAETGGGCGLGTTAHTHAGCEKHSARRAVGGGGAARTGAARAGAPALTAHTQKGAVGARGREGEGRGAASLLFAVAHLGSFTAP